jgi:3-hydroxyisobutyrate dehydrogenase
MNAIRRVGYIGIGNIGEPIAANVVAGGFDLMVFDLRTEALGRLRKLGAKVASSPHELGAFADLIEVSIAGDERIEAALLEPGGVLSGMKPGSVLALHSTMHPATVRRIGAAASAVGVEAIDAPITGGAPGARARSLCYMVGGSAEAVERCRPVFATSGSSVFHLGALGTGATAKLAQQMLTCMNLVATAESLRVAAAAGLDMTSFLAVLDISTAQSHVATRWRDEYSRTSREQAEGFHLGLDPAIAMARDLGVPVPGCELAQQTIMAAFGYGT